MKALIFLLTLSTWALPALAQLDEKPLAQWTLIGKLQFGGITKAKMEYLAAGSDTTYSLFIKDVREQPENNYFSISFKSVDGTYEKLYTILKSFFLPENKKNKKYARTFNLGNTGVNVQHYQLITGRGIMFYTQEGYTYWSENDVDKLFGKR